MLSAVLFVQNQPKDSVRHQDLKKVLFSMCSKFSRLYIATGHLFLWEIALCLAYYSFTWLGIPKMEYTQEKSSWQRIISY